MRWTLRNQIMAPMSLAMLVTVAGLSAFNAYSAAKRTRANIQRQVADVTRTLSNSTFPLTEGVLQQTRGLSGAHFVVLNRAGRIRDASEPRIAEGVRRAAIDIEEKALEFASPIHIESTAYYLAVGDLGRHSLIHPGEDRLVILYPAEEYRVAWRRAIVPPVAFGAAALLVVFLIGAIVASRIARPLNQLRSQLGRIAAGEFQAIPLPKRNDEIRDLAIDVNRMSEMLVEYEKQVRKTEQIRTMGQLARGLAHQLRNSATGAMMALDLHRESCPLNANDESLQIIHRQLQLITKYLQRFLTLDSKSNEAFTGLELADTAARLVELLKPTADHLGVALRFHAPVEAVRIRGGESLLEHAILNVLHNAIEAAERGGGESDARVTVELKADGGQAVLLIRDSGGGPDPDVADRILEPFVTTKESGAGLGLSIANEIVAAHQGELRWARQANETEFEMRFSLLETDAMNEAARVETARS